MEVAQNEKIQINIPWATKRNGSWLSGDKIQMKYLIALSIILLAGCTPSAQEQTWPILPDGLKDCKFYKLTDDSANTIRVVRCPMSSTTATYKVGKSTQTTVVVDGKEYTQK